jgi:hypothetical protein
MAEMPMGELAISYLRALFNSPEIPGGLAYPRALKQCKLDKTFESLDRIDRLLDAIRAEQKPTLGEFIAVDEQNNFLTLLAFYVSYMISQLPGKRIAWLSYDEFIAENPDSAKLMPPVYEYSIVCQIEKPDGGAQSFFPLVPIVERLFEGPTKSVRFSVEAYR